MVSGLFAEDEEDILDDVAAAVDAALPPAPADLSPKGNPDLIGHELIEKQLLSDFMSGRLPHAIIFAGAPGIGKATLAYRLARFLLSQAEDASAGLFGDTAPPESLFVARENPVFRRVASGGHADLMVVEREFDEKRGRLKKEISVDSVRQITPFLRKTAAEGGWRVIIVDSAEYLNHNSQNALLKILEEPPAKTVLILTTSQPGAFLPTIRSRCRLIPMRPLPENAVASLLDKMAPGIAGDEKTLLCRFSEGSIGKALRFYQDEGPTLYKSLLKIIGEFPTVNTVDIHDAVEKIVRSGADQTYETACEIILSWCERIVRAQARGEKLQDIVSGDTETFERLVRIYQARHFLECWEKTAHIFRMTEHGNLDKKQALISAFLTLGKPEYQGPQAY
jgi:DNA polymerase-3 subunit delta'